MRTPNKREIVKVNEFHSSAAPALTYWKAEAARLGFVKVTRALDEATKALGYEVAEARNLFENSGRRKRA